MAYFITDACVKCGPCADNCPLGLITRSTASAPTSALSAAPAPPAALSRQSSSSKMQSATGLHLISGTGRSCFVERR